ncbi:ABC transporter substrate-binding protein [Candidatus Caldatribacterium sp.]|uniref:ABC transporter substrate-binding protein n=1 Tax=Candidatus Caldatribacterium sp. TaxID=2282143 RepID=UPI00299556D9|nr:ABC transporter substrate-binding protein [Candidatus Caldatribacterium sp.]MDW8080602.1 ABC transporter substrate-binding protein [Candidatus Calescibacterium sp.]
MRWFVALSGVVFALVLAFSAFAAEPIKVGVVMGLTGPWASIDTPALNGVKLAAEEINKAGGILGRPVELKVVDTKADEGETVAAVIRLIENEKVSALIGYCDTHWVNIAAPLAREYGIPFITPGATHPRIPERTGAWLACFGDNAQAAVIAEYAVKDLGLKRGAIWVDTAVDFSVAVCAYFADALKHYGGEVVYEDYFETSWTDFSSMVARLKEYEDRGEVDFVYVGAIPGNCGLIVKQIREGGVTIPILGEDGFDTPLLVETAGEAAEGVIFATHMSLEDPNPLVQKFKSDYQAMFGNPPENAFAALGYDALKLLAKAIEIVGTDDPKKIPEGLAQIRDFQGVSGTISYEAGNQVPNKSVAVIEVKNGKFVTIKQVAPAYLPDPKIAK